MLNCRGPSVVRFIVLHVLLNIYSFTMKMQKLTITIQVKSICIILYTSWHAKPVHYHHLKSVYYLVSLFERVKKCSLEKLIKSGGASSSSHCTDLITRTMVEREGEQYSTERVTLCGVFCVLNSGVINLQGGKKGGQRNWLGVR